jgi:hypothetical protein
MKIFLIASVVLGLFACSGKKAGGKANPGTVDEAGLVDAFLAIQFNKEVTAGVPIIIKQKLSSGLMTPEERSADYAARFIGEAKRRDPRLAEAVSDFLEKNEKPDMVEAMGRLSTKHVVMTEAMSDELFKGGWEAYKTKFPGSPPYITLSRPGFSANGRLAILYLGKSSWFLSAAGRFFILEWENGRWVEVTKWRIGPEWKS